MKWNEFIFLFFLSGVYTLSTAQSQPDSLSIKQKSLPADDPSNFISRVEMFNEFQHYDHSGGFNLNQTVLRTIVKVGKRFTTRVDIPFVNNSFNYPAGYKSFGLGDISFRLLGYQLLERKRSAITASLEISLNTAESPALGTGKNLLIPLITYSTLLKDKKTLLVMTFQQANSISGDETRKDISFTKMQGIVLHFWSKRLWSVMAPELFIDYINGGTSMILKGRMTGAPTPRMNIWGQVNAGLYGNFVTRYNWGAEIGCRYFLLRKMKLN